MKISVSKETLTSKSLFCESVESGHSNQSQSARIAELLKISLPPVRMDSQCKYGILARGDANIYLRLPVRSDYQEKVWVIYNFFYFFFYYNFSRFWCS